MAQAQAKQAQQAQRKAQNSQEGLGAPGGGLGMWGKENQAASIPRGQEGAAAGRDMRFAAPPSGLAKPGQAAAAPGPAREGQEPAQAGFRKTLTTGGSALRAELSQAALRPNRAAADQMRVGATQVDDVCVEWHNVGR
jgi:hypothetical protein